MSGNLYAKWILQNDNLILLFSTFIIYTQTVPKICFEMRPVRMCCNLHVNRGRSNFYNDRPQKTQKLSNTNKCEVKIQGNGNPSQNCWLNTKVHGEFINQN
jgi:hypothetical protein